MDFLSNDWIVMMKDKYSMVIAAIPTIVVLILKAVAMLNPNVKNSTIRELLTWEKKPEPPKVP